MNNDSKPKQSTALPLLALLAMIGGLYLIFGRSSTVPDVIELSHPQDRDPQLVQMIDKQLEVVRQNPKNPRQRAILGMIFEANGMWTEARVSYMNATTLQPREPMWPHHASIAWLRLDDMKGATAWLREYSGRFPRFAPLQYRLGTALLKTDDLDGADAAFRELISLAPNSPQGYVGCGNALLRAGRVEEAVELLEKAVTLQSNYKSARYLLGRAYRALGRMEDAERELTLGAGGKTQPMTDRWSAEQTKYASGETSQKQQAVSLFEQGRYDAAIEIFEKDVASRPDDVGALVNLGAAYLQIGRLEEARATLLKARELDDSRFEIYINLSANSRRLGQFTEALAFADQAVALAPEMAAAHYARGATLLALQQNEQALEALKRAASYDARGLAIRQELANVCVRLHQYDDAIAHYQALVKMLPTRWEPHLGVGKVLFLQGRLDEAKKEVETGLKLAPNEPRLQALARQLSKDGA